MRYSLGYSRLYFYAKKPNKKINIAEKTQPLKIAKELSPSKNTANCSYAWNEQQKLIYVVSQDSSKFNSTRSQILKQKSTDF